MIDHAGLVDPGLYFYNDVECTPLPEVIARFHPDLVLASPWTRTSENEMAAAGYAPAHLFPAPFAYTLLRPAGARVHEGGGRLELALAPARLLVPLRAIRGRPRAPSATSRYSSAPRTPRSASRASSISAKPASR